MSFCSEHKTATSIHRTKHHAKANASLEKLAGSNRSSTHAVAREWDVPISIVLAAVLFNAVLCVINAHVIRISMLSVAVVEFVLVSLAGLVAIRAFRTKMLPWFVMVYIVLVFALVRGSITGQFEPKYVRDVILIPTFVVLGMTIPARALPKLIVPLHAVIVIGVLFETIFTDAYASLFQVRDYYMATRGFSEAAFWDTSSNLFVSATRPDDRFISFIELHRVSSFFLEPVTLGNYVVIVTIFICAFYHRLSNTTLAFLVLGNLAALVGCDGRLAAVSVLIVVFVSLFARWLPRSLAFLYLPGVLVAVVMFTIFVRADPTVDNFSGRLAFSMALLERYDIWEWLGMSNVYLSQALDSGIAYMIMTQSVIGVALFWGILVFGARYKTIEQRIVLHGICIFVALNMLVSYSIFTIKIAALLWFIYGALQSDTDQPVATNSIRERRVPLRRILRT